MPKPKLPMLLMTDLSTQAQGKSQSDGYYLTGDIVFNHLAEFPDNDHYLAIFDTLQTIITAIHRKEDALKALQPTLNLTEISFDSMEQTILTEQEHEKFYSSVDLKFSWQIFP